MVNDQKSKGNTLVLEFCTFRLTKNPGVHFRKIKRGKKKVKQENEAKLVALRMGSLSRSKQQIPSSDLSKCKQNK